jgi:glycine cleavage system H protein
MSIGPALPDRAAPPKGGAEEKMPTTFPNDLRYTHDHEWLRVQGERWRVGITQFAVDQLGDITLVDLPKEGDEITKGQRFGTIESVKSVSDLYAPVSGKVVAINAGLKDAPEDVNNDPYAKGWMIELEPNDKSELDELMTPDAYGKHVAAQ